MPRAINHSLATPPGSPPPAPGPSIAGGAEGPPAERRGRRDEQSSACPPPPAAPAWTSAPWRCSPSPWPSSPSRRVSELRPLAPLLPGARPGGSDGPAETSALSRSPCSCTALPARAPAAAQMRLASPSNGCAELEADRLPFLPLLHPSLAFFKKLAKAVLAAKLAPD